MRISVFTPTYNRAYIIETLYHSLQQQTFQDFEWIVINDGSTDGTDALFNRICAEENNFPIRYVRTENGGKHRAINHGVSLARGDLFFIVDSDDYLTNDALEIIDTMERTIPADQKKSFGGICGQRGFSPQISIGKSFSGDILDITALQRPQYGITGDKSEVFYTDILRKYPFPEISGEKFVTECVVWDKIAADGYKLRFFNKIIMICDYLSDGLSAQGKSLFEKNPKGWGLYIKQSVQYGKLHGLSKWNEYLQFFYCARKIMPFSEIATILNVNPFVLWLRINGLRLFYKLYQ